jgi:hypothetical protein
MRLTKNLFFILIFPALIYFFDSVPFAGAQEMSIEESYLQESVETMIIREYAKSTDRGEKLMALEYLRQMMDNGGSPKEIHAILANMALEGILNKIRSEGRVVNDFPDIRIKAVEYLGELEIKEASDTLLRVLLIDNEPSVVSTAVRSLSKLGFNDNDYTLKAILYVFRQYDVKRPNNVLAISVIDSCDAFIQNGETKNPWIYAMLMNISNNPSYIRPVRDYASRTLTKIYKRGGN